METTGSCGNGARVGTGALARPAAQGYRAAGGWPSGGWPSGGWPSGGWPSGGWPSFGLLHALPGRWLPQLCRFCKAGHHRPQSLSHHAIPNRQLGFLLLIHQHYSGLSGRIMPVAAPVPWLRPQHQPALRRIAGHRPITTRGNEVQILEGTHMRFTSHLETYPPQSQSLP